MNKAPRSKNDRGALLCLRLIQFEGTGVKLVVGAAFGHELIMVAAFDDSAMVEDHDDVGVLDGGKAMSNNEDGASFHEGIHAALYEGFGAGVDGRGGFVENHDRRIADGGTSNGEQLALSLGKTSPIARKHGIVAMWQHANETVGVFCNIHQNHVVIVISYTIITLLTQKYNLILFSLNLACFSQQKASTMLYQ